MDIKQMTTLLSRRQFSAFGAASLALPSARAGTTWRLATGYRNESFQTVNLVVMAAELETATQGEMRIAIHADNALVKLADIRAAVQGGRIEAGETLMSGLVADMPITGADAVPFITASYADARRLWRCQRPLIERHFAERGLVPLYAVAWPPQGLFATKPIVNSSDLAGSRMRTYNATTTRIASMLSATPVDVVTAEVGQAVLDGRIDSMITSAVIGVENKVWSRLRYYYEINAWFPKNIVFANAKALMALSPVARNALTKAAAEAELRGWVTSEAVAQSSVGELRRNGIKVEQVPHEVSATLKRFGERFSLEWVRQVGIEGNQIFIPYFTQS